MAIAASGSPSLTSIPATSGERGTAVRLNAQDRTAPLLFAVAGEPSGDARLAACLRSWKAQHPQGRILGAGGPQAQAEGLRPLVDFEALPVNGWGDVLRAAPRLWRAYRVLKRALRRESCTQALFVDYPGMNLRLAATALRLGLPVDYEAPPQIWLYRDSDRRAAALARRLAGARLRTVFPWEVALFRSAGLEVVASDVEPGTLPPTGAGSFGKAGTYPVPEPEVRSGLLLGPGSREPLLRRNLPVWLACLARWHAEAPLPPDLRHLRIVVPATRAHSAARLAAAARLPPDLTWEVETEPGKALRSSQAGILQPGSFTLEAFRMGLPFQCWAVVDSLTYFRARQVLRHPWAALPNLILEREAVFEWVKPAFAWRKSGPIRKWPFSAAATAPTGSAAPIPIALTGPESLSLAEGSPRLATRQPDRKPTHEPDCRSDRLYDRLSDRNPDRLSTDKPAPETEAPLPTAPDPRDLRHPEENAEIRAEWMWHEHRRRLESCLRES